MKYEYVLFDLDGTVIDSKIGITKSVEYALKKFEIEVNDLKELEKFIGPPLKESFKLLYGFDEENSTLAIDYFREYFMDKGIFENVLYPNIKEMLTSLKNKKIHLALSTSKPTVFAKKILEHLDMEHLFEVVVGSNLDNTRTDKAEIIEETIRLLGVSDLSKVIMIGDRKHDLIGANKKSIDAMAVTYGYGGYEELKEHSPKYIVDSPLEIAKIILL